VGLQAPDDAAVYALDERRAVVATLDFFTPLVDDPEDFGAVAAANALSDLYAMGARPVFALNVLAVRVSDLGDAVVGGILRGAAAVCEEAGIPVGGGHSIDDPEPKFGLVALGLADPEELWRKSGARAGDRLVLAKALGTGVITTAIKAGEASEESMRAAVASMRRLNAAAARVLRDFSPRAVTDVTGFGLLGHLLEMCRASGLSARIEAPAPRLLPGALELARAGSVPGGTRSNQRFLEAAVSFEEGVAEELRVLLCDAQTSGGLMAAVGPEQAEALRAAWAAEGYEAAVVGRFEASEEEGTPRIRVGAG